MTYSLVQNAFANLGLLRLATVSHFAPVERTAQQLWLIAILVGGDGPTAAAVGVLWPAASTAQKLKPSFVVQAANTGEQPLAAEMQGWVDAAKATYKRGDPGENLWLQQQVVG